MKRSSQRGLLKLTLAGVAVIAVGSTPLLGSAAGLANSPFAIRAENSAKPSVSAIKPFLKSGTGTGSTAPAPTPTAGSTTPPPSTEPTRAPDPNPGLVSMAIDTSLPSCLATTSGFQLNVASFDSQDPAKTPLPLNAKVDWGDSSSADLATGTNSHVYKAGKYNLTIDGKLGGLNTVPLSAVSCIARVDHIGETTGIVTLEGFLKGGANFSYIAAPPTSLKNGANMVSGATRFTGSGVETWVLPNLVNGGAMFAGDVKFDADLSNFNPKNLKNAGGMFNGATVFTGKGLDKWNTSSLTTANAMFQETNYFNKDISGWDMSHVTNFNYMFYQAKLFNQNISTWNVGSGKSFHSMFASTTAFDQPLDSWDMSSATTLVQMFYQSAAFNQDLNSWNMSNVTDMTNLFRSAQKFNGKIDKWDTSKVTNMFYMFWGTPSFKQDVSKWNVSRVTNWTGFYTNSLLKSSYPSYVPSKFQNSTGYSG